MSGGPAVPPGLWPYRSKPKPDECLSSWIVRVAQGNGLRLHTFSHMVWPGRQIWNRDVDGLSDAKLVEAMAAGTATPLETARRTAIASLAGSLFDRHNPLGTTRWVLRAGVYHRIRRCFGQQYCPRCLSEGERYYRLSWRLAWVTVCPVHKTILLDRCPKCRSPVMFHRPAMNVGSITTCAKCKFDLRHAPLLDVVDTAALRFQARNNEILQQGWAQLGPYTLPYSCGYFDVVHQVAHILSSGPRAEALRAVVVKKWGGDPAPPERRTDRLELERLDVLSRHRALGLAARLIQDWPQRFVEACQRGDVWQSWALKDEDRPPFALWEPVRLQIYRPYYSYARGEVASARRYLMKRGIRPTPNALKRLLGIDSEKFSSPSRGLTQSQQVRVGRRN